MHRTKGFVFSSIFVWLVSFGLPSIDNMGKQLYGFECLLMSFLLSLAFFMHPSTDPILISALLSVIVNFLMASFIFIKINQLDIKAIYVNAMGWAMIVFSFFVLVMLESQMLVSLSVGILVWFLSIFMAGIHSIMCR